MYSGQCFFSALLMFLQGSRRVVVIPYRFDFEAKRLGHLFTKKVAEEFDLFEIMRAPGAHHQMQSKLQPFPKPERAFH